MLRALYLWERDILPIIQETGCIMGPVRKGPKISAPPSFEPQSIKLIASCYNDYSIPTAPLLKKNPY
jgi:hypothetical protein